MRSIVLSFLLLAGIGCGPPETIISGKITYRGKTPALGQVSFIDEQGNALNAILQDDGTYTIRYAHPGKMRVVVLSTSNLPAKYTVVESTELKVEIIPGLNTYTVDLP